MRFVKETTKMSVFVTTHQSRFSSQSFGHLISIGESSVIRRQDSTASYLLCQTVLHSNNPIVKIGSRLSHNPATSTISTEDERSILIIEIPQPPRIRQPSGHHLLHAPRTPRRTRVLRRARIRLTRRAADGVRQRIGRPQRMSRARAGARSAGRFPQGGPLARRVAVAHAAARFGVETQLVVLRAARAAGHLGAAFHVAAPALRGVSLGVGVLRGGGRTGMQARETRMPPGRGAESWLSWEVVVEVVVEEEMDWKGRCLSWWAGLFPKSKYKDMFSSPMRDDGPEGGPREGFMVGSYRDDFSHTG
jgi:hypothetical protein